jgi:hypothetical protein
MRRLATGGLALALLALALAATVDALRGARPDRVEAIAALRAAGASGTLTYSDDHCALHAVRLPGLTPAPAPGFASCEPHIPSGGLGVVDGEVVWSGLGYQAAQVVLSRSDLTSAVRGDPQSAQLSFGGAGPYEARQVVALGRRRFAVILDHQRPPFEILLGFFDGRRLVDLRLGLIGPDDFIRPSHAGRYVALVRPGEVRVLEAAGGEIPLPGVSLPHAIAWSPDDRWTALATRYSVYVFPSEHPDTAIRIPLAVRDLDWGP